MNVSADLFGYDAAPDAAPDGKSNEWFTPRSILSLLPPIDLDPCWHPKCNIKAAQTYDIRRRQDGLVLPWTRNRLLTWVNPPYDNCAAWVLKCAIEHAAGAQIIAFIPAKSGEVYWYDYVWPRASWVGFLRGRTVFDTVLGAGTGPGMFSNALIGYGDDDGATLAHIRSKFPAIVFVKPI